MEPNKAYIGSARGQQEPARTSIAVLVRVPSAPCADVGPSDETVEAIETRVFGERGQAGRKGQERVKNYREQKQTGKR